MSSTSKVILIENDKLYHYVDSKKQEVTDYSSLQDDITIIIDDDYFFYFTIDAKPTKPKKMAIIIKSYMRTVFVKTDSVFTVFTGGGKIVVLTMTDSIRDLIRLNSPLFAKASRFTTPLIESMQRDNDFYYQTDTHSYMVSDGIIRIAPIPSERKAVGKRLLLDMVAEVNNYMFMGSIQLPGVVRMQKASSHLYITMYGALFLYLIFVISRYL